MPRVLETIRYFRQHSDLPISFTDPQGPFTTALTLADRRRCSSGSTNIPGPSTS